MFECNVAYRFSNGEVEGFKGVSLTSKAKATEDAINQVRRKVEIINEKPPQGKAEVFDKDRLILTEADAKLSEDEHKQIQRDWNTNVRY